MHAEDNAIGLDVENPSGVKFKAYGDKRLMDDVNGVNMQQCALALQASVDEIYTAWKTKVGPPASGYAAWRHAPTLESARSDTQELAPLFKDGAGPPLRNDISKRREWKYTTNYLFWIILRAIEASGLWDYPITLDCK